MPTILDKRRAYVNCGSGLFPPDLQKRALFACTLNSSLDHEPSLTSLTYALNRSLPESLF
jgi:hypothetical protein